MRRSPRNVKIAFSHAGLTHYGGILFFNEFSRMLQLRRFLTRRLRRNHDYQLSQMILSLVYPIILGLDRLETASLLRSNGTFQYLTGLPTYPTPQSLRRFLLQAAPDFREQRRRWSRPTHGFQVARSHLNCGRPDSPLASHSIYLLSDWSADGLANGTVCMCRWLEHNPFSPDSECC